MKIPNVLCIIQVEEILDGKIGLDFCDDKKLYFSSLSELEGIVTESDSKFIVTIYPYVRGWTLNSEKKNCNYEFSWIEFCRNRMVLLAEKYQQEIFSKQKTIWKQIFEYNNRSLRNRKISIRAKKLLNEAIDSVEYMSQNLPKENDSLEGALLFGSLAENDYYPMDIDILLLKTKSARTSIKLPKRLQKNINPLILTEDLAIEEMSKETPTARLLSYNIASDTLTLFSSESLLRVKDFAQKLILESRKMEYLEYLCGRKLYCDLNTNKDNSGSNFSLTNGH